MMPGKYGLKEKLDLIRQKVEREEKTKARSRGEELLRQLLVSEVGEIRWDELGVVSEAARNVIAGGKHKISIRSNSTSDADTDCIVSEVRMFISREGFVSAEICVDIAFGSWTDWISIGIEDFLAFVKNAIDHAYARAVLLKTSDNIYLFQFIEDYIEIIALRRDMN